MSESTTESTDTEQQTQGEPDEQLGEGGKKALTAEREARRTAEQTAAALQKQLDDINAANLSDLERAQQAAATAQAEADAARAEALRYRIASEYGITENADLILTGADEETMLKQAALWRDRTPTSPKPDRSQGARDGDPASSTADMFAAAIESGFTR